MEISTDRQTLHKQAKEAGSTLALPLGSFGGGKTKLKTKQKTKQPNQNKKAKSKLFT